MIQPTRLSRFMAPKPYKNVFLLLYYIYIYIYITDFVVVAYNSREAWRPGPPTVRFREMRGASVLSLVSLLLRSSSTCAGLSSLLSRGYCFLHLPILSRSFWLRRDGTGILLTSSFQFRKRLSSQHSPFSLHAGGGGGEGGGGNKASVAFQEIDIICHLASFIEVRFDWCFCCMG